MKKENIVKLQCSKCKNINYYTNRNKKNPVGKKLEIKKYCPKDKIHTIHKEAKK